MQYISQYKIDKLPLEEGDTTRLVVTGGHFKDMKKVGKMVYLPEKTLDFLKEVSDGAFSPCVSVLIDFALQSLQEQNVKLFGSKK